MKIVSVILARGGSKGIPGKNIKNFEGKPLISHTIEYALSSKHLINKLISKRPNWRVLILFWRYSERVRNTVRRNTKIADNNLVNTNLYQTVFL